MPATDAHREVAIESDPEVVGIVTLIHNNMLQQGRLMPEDLGQTGTWLNQHNRSKIINRITH